MTPRPIETTLDLNDASAGMIMDRFHAHLQQVVALHTAMFDKLLFQSDDIPLSLAELFEDVGNTYLRFSEGLTSRYCARRSKVEQELDAGIEPAGRVLQARVGPKPRVSRSKQLAQPLEHQADRARVEALAQG